MADEHDQDGADEDRLVIPLDPEVALRALLEVDPDELPPENEAPSRDRAERE